MEINEKLDIFFRTAIEAANEKSEEILEAQKQSYTHSIQAYEKKKQEELETRVRIAQNQVEKEENRIISEKIIELKKEYYTQKEQKKTELFQLVEEKLAEYCKSDAYQNYLLAKMKEAKTYAGESPVTVYIDPTDAHLRTSLQKQMGADGNGLEILVSRESFGGGMRAVIREKNLLMDESFGRKLAEEKERFS